jgi:succinyl-CoA synthetase beta subunit
MKLHEYQAKAFFQKHGIPIQKGAVIERVDELDGLALGYPVVLKSQVLVGGRGKAGGIKLADDVSEAKAKAARILGMDIKGETVRRLLVVEAANIETEYYLAFTVDRAAQKVVLIASAAGGIDIEEVAKTSPEKIVKLHIDPMLGFHGFHARTVAERLGFRGARIAEFAGIAEKLYRLCVSMDAELAEINPLAIADGKLLAVDAKLIVDDNALFRHTDLPPNEEVTELERVAKENDLSYVELEGDIAVIGNGAGLVMSTLDMLAHFGGSAANFLDIGGGATKDNMKTAMDIVLRKPGVRALFINIFGGITRCDDIANGIVESPPKVPASIRLTGTNEEEGTRILRSAGISANNNPEEAAQRAVALAKGA